MNMLRRNRTGANESGASIVEFSVVGTLLMLMLFGIIDMARLFQAWSTVQHSSRSGARFAVTGKSSCAAASADRDGCIASIAKKSMGAVSSDPSKINVTFRAWDYQATTWTGPTANETGKQCDQLEVKVTYTHQMMTPMLKAILPGGVKLVGRQRMTNEPWAMCNENDGVS